MTTNRKTTDRTTTTTDSTKPATLDGFGAFYSIEQTGNVFGVKHRVIRKLIASRELPAVKVGGVWRIAERDVLAWIAAQR